MKVAIILAAVAAIGLVVWFVVSVTNSMLSNTIKNNKTDNSVKTKSNNKKDEE